MRSKHQKASALLWLVLAAGMVAELAVGAWHGVWGIQPLLPAVLTGGLFQQVMSTRAPRERRSVPVLALVLTMITCALAVISSVVAWIGGDVSKRTAALVAATAALFFFGSLVTLQLQARGIDRSQHPQ